MLDGETCVATSGSGSERCEVPRCRSCAERETLTERRWLSQGNATGENNDKAREKEGRRKEGGARERQSCDRKWSQRESRFAKRAVAEKRWRAGVLSSTCQETLCAWVAVPVVVPRTCLAARFTPGGTLSASAEGSALCCSGAGGGGSRDRTQVRADVSRALRLTHSQPARGLSVRAWACHTPTSCRAAAHRPEPPAQSCATHARGAAPSRRAPAAAGDAVPADQRVPAAEQQKQVSVSWWSC